MLSEEDVSSCIDRLIRLGVLAPVLDEGDGGELIKFNVPPEGMIGRIVGGEFGEPPEGVELVAWFSCIMLKILLEERDTSVMKKDFIAMAAVMTGFMSKAAVDRLLHSEYDRPVISERRAKQERKQPRRSPG